MNRWVKVLLAVVAMVAIAALIVLNPSPYEPEGELSRQILQPGPFMVVQEAVEWTDTSRPTAANRDYEGDDARTLSGRLWYPSSSEGAPYPLVVYSHGYMSSHSEGRYLVEFLVSRGYLMVSVDFPLSNGSAPGGPALADVVHQPGDLSFVIDRLLARNADSNDPLFRMIDPGRIGAVGLSLGGLTTQLLAYHPDMADSRIKAAVSMAGPSEFLTPQFFSNNSLPFMYIGGTADALVPFVPNAAPITGKARNSTLVSLQDGTHLGFVNGVEVFLRWFHNPDSLGCMGLMSALRAEQEGAGNGGVMPGFSELLGAANGVSEAVTEPCTGQDMVRAMRPAQQQALVKLAVFSFLESILARDRNQRNNAGEFLLRGLPAENPQISVTASR